MCMRAGGAVVDCGALCLPGLAERVHSLVRDAAASGARVLAGGELPSRDGGSALATGQFYPPTVIADVTPEMRLFQEEVFGPVMTICRCRDDAHAVRTGRRPCCLAVCLLARILEPLTWLCAVHAGVGACQPKHDAAQRCNCNVGCKQLHVHR
jgi:Aldehyde dehydrogenase family